MVNSLCLTGTCWTLDVENDRRNCGAIGNVCTEGLDCVSGKCVDFQNDTQNCGARGRQCLEFQSCRFGDCWYQDSSNCRGPGIVCPLGSECWGFCRCSSTGSLPCNGSCSVDFATDSNNCGWCENVCPAGTHCNSYQCL
jgi:hypothetical protein